MESIRSIVDSRFIAMLLIVSVILFFLHPNTDVNLRWLENYDEVLSYLKDNIATKYKYIELGSIQQEPRMPYYPKTNFYFRSFSIYQYDPNKVPDEKNFLIFGYIYPNGRIVIYSHCRANKLIIFVLV